VHEHVLRGFHIFIPSEQSLIPRIIKLGIPHSINILQNNVSQADHFSDLQLLLWAANAQNATTACAVHHGYRLDGGWSTH
ncbi:hypothetical protein B9Q04_08460, partial [Candidatus Marsarchaeota G2 archaeon BE_D]